jgi:hypothetical protein
MQLVGEVHIEAEDPEAALARYSEFRHACAKEMRGKLEETGVQKFSLKPVREMIEADEAWLENHKLRAKFQQEWRYEERLTFLQGTSRVRLKCRVAIGPQDDSNSPINIDRPKHRLTGVSKPELGEDE